MKIELKKVNESFFIANNLPSNIFKIICNNLSAYEEGYQFSPAYKMGQWDGKSHYYKILSSNSLAIPLGFKNIIFKFLNKNNLTYEKVNFEESEFSEENYIKWVKSQELPFSPYDYQLDAAIKILKNKRGIIQSATGSGKSVCMNTFIISLLYQNAPHQLTGHQ